MYGLIITLVLAVTENHQVNGLSRPALPRPTCTVASIACSRRAAIFTALWAPSAFAYERRDVGGEDRSPEQAAYNLQAYETNNRLEREGFKLDTAEEQKASLMAALSDYAYEPTKDRKESKSKDGSRK